MAPGDLGSLRELHPAAHHPQHTPPHAQGTRYAIAATGSPVKHGSGFLVPCTK